MMTERTFPRGGREIPHRKEATENKAILVMGAPPVVTIPMQQHIGAPCEPIVAVGDHVKIGQKIGESKKYVCAPIHASVSGRVTAVEPRSLLNGQKVMSVVIENDGQEEQLTNSPSDVKKMSPKAIREAVKEAGIVGMGGAGFPTHIKLDPPKPVDTILINGAECEPYLTCDHRLMVEKPAELVGGLRAIMKAAGASRGIIGIEGNKPDAVAILKETIKDDPDLSIVVLQVRYPQGAEKQLIKAVLNREVPSGALPCEVGCVVNNVHTAIAVYQALTEGVPSYERVVTISGGAVLDPRNVLVRIGTPVQALLDYCGGLMGEPAVIVSGGPMTGPPVVNLEGPVVKNLSGILALTPEEVDFDENRPCIRCARCVNACPMGLAPNMLGLYSDKGLYDEAAKIGLRDCIECGLCSYVCPSRRALVTWIKSGKAGLAAQQTKEKVV